MADTQFKEAYAQLNDAQRTAVDAIDGPVLVVAGPGTGKTQLLSARVAAIMQRTDTPPHNILCLTFTESGASNMRERLSQFIGQAAYDVTISTYHAFGDSILQRFPQYFLEMRLQNLIDKLGQRQMISEIVDAMSYTNPLKQARHHLGDLTSTISEVKRALLDSDDLRAIAAENAKFIKNASSDVQHILEGFSRMSPKLANTAPLFEKVLSAIRQYIPKVPANQRFGSLAAAAASELQNALDEANASNKTTPLKDWKNKWLAKNADNEFVIGGELANNRITALADVIDKYQAALQKQGLYDFDDMILRPIEALERNNELKYTLQEQYLYILLDEFQDTNAAQLRLIQLLTDNPVHEGRPNIMAVGDDDQAIYAFQGADYSNMLDFIKLYRDVTIINLTENYRSHPDILLSAGNIACQIESRLTDTLDQTTKQLIAANKDRQQVHIERREFIAIISENDWIASRIQKLVRSGTKPSEIAVLAPQHKYLEPLVPYLNAKNIPVRYERREDILEAPIVRQLITMCRLVIALGTNDEKTANALWPEVLSFEFWQFPTTDIWQLSWRTHDSRNDTWTKVLIEDGQKFRAAGLLFLGLARKIRTETHETILDYLIGSAALDTHEADLPKVISPLRDYYMNPKNQTKKPQLFYETLSHLTVLRSRLREHQAIGESALSLQDMIVYVDLYKEAGEQMLNTSPYAQAADAVQLMTVFKAKGLEFEHVFIMSSQDEVWGASSKSNSNKLTLPENLLPIRHGGATEDERLRILYVAMTRAKQGLYLTSTTQSFTGKTSKRLKYLDEREEADGTFKAYALPEYARSIIADGSTAPAQQLLELNWQSRHATSLQNQQLSSLLQHRLKAYRLSPTHLNAFLDLMYNGPRAFFLNTLLHFPTAPSADGQFGNAIHETLEWVQHQIDKTGTLPDTNDILNVFEGQIKHQNFTADQAAIEIERGNKALTTYLSQRSKIFKPGDKAEVNFRSEEILVDGMQLSGKIDRLEIDAQNKTITVVDYKTGKSFSKWLSDPKLHAYKRQLYCYKLLIEHSPSYTGYTVTSGRLEFIEPNNAKRIDTLELHFDTSEEKRVIQLLTAMWQHVQSLNFPDTSIYNVSLTGIKKFEEDLLNGSI